MGKINFPALVVTFVVQFVFAYLWYGHLFGETLVADGGKSIDVLKIDGITLLLVLLGSFGLTHLLDWLTELTGTKTVVGGLVLGLKVGVFGLGLMFVMMLGLMGFGKMALLVVFGHIMYATMLTGMIVTKTKTT